MGEVTTLASGRRPLRRGRELRRGQPPAKLLEGAGCEDVRVRSTRRRPTKRRPRSCSSRSSASGSPSLVRAAALEGDAGRPPDPHASCLPLAHPRRFPTSDLLNGMAVQAKGKAQGHLRLVQRPAGACIVGASRPSRARSRPTWTTSRTSTTSPRRTTRRPPRLRPRRSTTRSRSPPRCPRRRCACHILAGQGDLQPHLHHVPRRAR